MTVITNPEKTTSLEAEASPLVTLPQFCSMYSWPSTSAMRAYIYRAKDLGIQSAFVRVGRRVLVDPNKFFTLIRQVEPVNSSKAGR